MILKDFFKKMAGFNTDINAASIESLAPPTNSNETTKTQDNEKESNEKQNEKTSKRVSTLKTKKK